MTVFVDEATMPTSTGTNQQTAKIANLVHNGLGWVRENDDAWDSLYPALVVKDSTVMVSVEGKVFQIAVTEVTSPPSEVVATVEKTD